MTKAFSFCESCGAPRGQAPDGSGTDTGRCARCGHVFANQDPAIDRDGADEADLVGQVIGGCRIIEQIGASGFGTVYRAEDQTLQRTVAIKVFPPSLSADAAAERKFIREAVTAAQLNHPGIVAVHKVGKDDHSGLHYVVMEYVDGGSLAGIVERKGAFLWTDALPLMIQACDAMASAHEAHVVHRDLKPENLLLGASGRLKIADFGLAQSLSATVRDDQVMGTPPYMAPEQFEGKPFDARSDIYSLGICFYFMLSKALPFEGESLAQLIFAKLKTPPRPLWGVNSAVPRNLWLVIERMIARRREDRYVSLRDVIEALQSMPKARPLAESSLRETALSTRSEFAALMAAAAPDPAAAPPTASEEMPAPSDDASGYVFVSYKRGEESRIAWMLRHMQDLGMTMWYDQGITPGGDWFAEILDHIENARAYVVFLTKDSVRSRHIDNEVKHAYQCGTPILPVRLEEVDLPKGLRFVLNNVQWIDASLDRERSRTQWDRALRALARRKA